MPVQTSAFSYWPAGDANKTIVTDGAAFEKMLRHLHSGPALTVDYETSGTAWHAHSRSCGVALATWDRDDGRIWNWYVPYRHQTGEKQLTPSIVLPALKGLLEDETRMKIAQNIKFEDHFSRVEGIQIRGPRYDTMIAGHLFDENIPLKLETRAERHLGRTDARYWEHQMAKEVLRLARANKMGIKAYKYQYGYAQTSINLCGTYACFDTQHETELYHFYERNGVSSNYPRIFPTEMALTEALCDMEVNGLPVDIEYLENLRDSLGGVKAGIHDQIQALLGHDMFNLGSDDELRFFMSQKMRLPLWKKTRGNKYSVDREVLEMFKDRSPVLKMMLDWRDADKLENTYTTSILKRIDVNGIVHPDFQQVGTNTSRLACRDPNFQNQPKDDDDRAKAYSGKKLEDGGIDPWSIRRAFTVRKDGTRIIPRVFLDYSQIELRTLAFYSADPTMLQVYLTGGDIHTQVSKEVGCDRRIAKVINFGLCLVGSSRVLTKQSGYVRLDKVEPWHLLWDGVDWVNHDGLVCRGEQEVMTYDGLEATPDHKVYAEDGRCLPLSCMEQLGLRIAVGESSGSPQRYNTLSDGEGWSPREAYRCGSCVQCLLCEEADHSGSDSEGVGWLLLPVGDEAFKIQRPTGSNSWSTLRLDETTVRAGYSRLIETLQRSWDQGLVQVERALHSLGFGEVAAFGVQGVGFGSDRQRRALLPTQYPTCLSVGEFESSSEKRGESLQSGTSVVRRESSFEQERIPSVPRVPEAAHERISRTKKAKVYDVLNAGPRRRFTVEGKIVSNSYCMTEVGMARQAGMSIEKARAFMDNFFARFPGIPRLRERLWTQVRMNPESKFTNLFGRTRTVPLINSSQQWEQGRAERQVIGSLIQGTASELTKESIVRVSKFFKEENLPAMLVNTVHDEIQIDCPAGCLTDVVRGVRRLMEDYPEFLPIPIIVDGEYTTKSWADKQPLPTS